MKIKCMFGFHNFKEIGYYKRRYVKGFGGFIYKFSKCRCCNKESHEICSTYEEEESNKILSFNELLEKTEQNNK